MYDMTTITNVLGMSGSGAFGHPAKSRTRLLLFWQHLAHTYKQENHYNTTDKPAQKTKLATDKTDKRGMGNTVVVDAAVLLQKSNETPEGLRDKKHCNHDCERR
jgi:hypothetical protein